MQELDEVQHAAIERGLLEEVCGDARRRRRERAVPERVDDGEEREVGSGADDGDVTALGLAPGGAR